MDGHQRRQTLALAKEAAEKVAAFEKRLHAVETAVRFLLMVYAQDHPKAPRG